MPPKQKARSKTIAATPSKPTPRRSRAVAPSTGSSRPRGKDDDKSESFSPTTAALRKLNEQEEAISKRLLRLDEAEGNGDISGLNLSYSLEGLQNLISGGSIQQTPLTDPSGGSLLNQNLASIAPSLILGPNYAATPTVGNIPGILGIQLQASGGTGVPGGVISGTNGVTPSPIPQVSQVGNPGLPTLGLHHSDSQGSLASGLGMLGDPSQLLQPLPSAFTHAAAAYAKLQQNYEQKCSEHKELLNQIHSLHNELTEGNKRANENSQNIFDSCLRSISERFESLNVKVEQKDRLEEDCRTVMGENNELQRKLAESQKRIHELEKQVWNELAEKETCLEKMRELEKKGTEWQESKERHTKETACFAQEIEQLRRDNEEAHSKGNKLTTQLLACKKTIAKQQVEEDQMSRALLLVDEKARRLTREVTYLRDQIKTHRSMDQPSYPDSGRKDGSSTILPSLADHNHKKIPLRRVPLNIM